MAAVPSTPPEKTQGVTSDNASFRHLYGLELEKKPVVEEIPVTGMCY